MKTEKTVSLRNTAGNNREIITVFIIALLSRAFLFALSLASLRLSGNGRSLIETFGSAGDVPHYMYIAQHWYQSSGEKANLIVFYPFLPMLIAAFRVILRSYLASGLVISWLSFAVASCYFYKLLRLDYDEEKTAYGMVGFFTALFGIFFISAHTESLFVMLVAISIYYTRKKNWLAAGIAGMCAALTKTQGVLLFLPAVYEIIIDSTENKRFDKKSLFTLLIPLGFFLYLLLNRIYGGSFFKFVEYEEAEPWYNRSVWVADSLATSYNTGSGNFTLSMFLYWPQIIMYFIAVLALFVGAYKKVRTSYLVFIGAYTGLTYFQSWMLSGGRYISSCIPLYVVYAAIDNKYVKNTLLLVTGILNIFIAILWLQGQAIM